MFRDVDDDGDQDPITVTLQVGGRTVDVPLIAIASPKSLSMESLEVEFEAEVTLPTAVDADPGLLKRAKKSKTEVVPPATISLDMRSGLIKRATRFKVKACFKMSEPAETVEALRDALTEQVREQLRG